MARLSPSSNYRYRQLCRQQDDDDNNNDDDRHDLTHAAPVNESVAPADSTDSLRGS